MNLKKIILISGGILSSLGKGIFSSSLASLHLTKKISYLKIDPYLNINTGNLNPNEHGEIFVTRDGGETDIDLGI